MNSLNSDPIHSGRSDPSQKSEKEEKITLEEKKTDKNKKYEYFKTKKYPKPGDKSIGIAEAAIKKAKRA
jgi:hypothetical protein